MRTGAKRRAPMPGVALFATSSRFQEYIPGDDDVLWSYHAVRRRDGAPARVLHRPQDPHRSAAAPARAPSSSSRTTTGSSRWARASPRAAAERRLQDGLQARLARPAAGTCSRSTRATTSGTTWARQTALNLLAVAYAWLLLGDASAACRRASTIRAGSRSSTTRGPSARCAREVRSGASRLARVHRSSRATSTTSSRGATPARGFASGRGACTRRASPRPRRAPLAGCGNGALRHPRRHPRQPSRRSRPRSSGSRPRRRRPALRGRPRGLQRRPDECVAMLRGRGARCIAGNHDLIGTGLARLRALLQQGDAFAQAHAARARPRHRGLPPGTAFAYRARRRICSPTAACATCSST